MDQNPTPHPYGPLLSLGRFSVKNPVLLNILLVTLLVLGALSLSRLPQEQFAEVPFYWVNIIVPYPGVSASDIETSVTIPIENEYAGISRLKRVSSVTSEGLAVVRVEFDDGVTADEFRSLFQDAQTRFTRVRLPEGVLSPVVDDFSSADFVPVLEVIVSGSAPYEQLRSTARRLRDRLLKVSDVSGVEYVGLRERQLLVMASETDMASRSLSTNELVRAIQVQNANVPGGGLSTAEREYLVRVLGDLKTPAAFENIILRRSADGSGGLLRVRDVARVDDAFDPDAPLARFDGEPAISLRLTKVPGGSSLDVVNGARQVIAELAPGLAEGIRVTPFNDSTAQVRDSLDVLTSNALFGLFLLVIVLSAFFGVRNALMVALGIPTTFALTFIILELLGETINTNTLFGLVLVLGMIVDHGIVIVENSFRLNQTGLKRHDAAILGVDQVAWPVIAATLTTVAAFLPLMLVPGTIGKFLRVIPLTVSIALLVSTLEALVFLPSHFADWGREKPKGSKARRPAKVRREPGAWFEPFAERYSGWLEGLYRQRGWVVGISAVILIGSFSLGGALRQDLFAAEDFTYLTIDLSTPLGTPLHKTDEVVRAYEAVLLPLKGQGEVVAVRSAVGGAGGEGSTRTPNRATILVDLSEIKEGRTRPIDAILADLQARTLSIPGAEVVNFRKAVNGPPTASPVAFRVTGDDLGQLVEVSEQIQDWLAEYNELYNIEDDYSPGNPELRVVINPERASAFGLDPLSVGAYFRARYDGQTLGTVFWDNEEIPVILRFDQAGLQLYDSLEQALLPTPDGRLIPFSSVARIEQSPGLASIRRVEGKRELTITAQAFDETRLRLINTQVLEKARNLVAANFPTLAVRAGGEFSEFADLLFQILRVFALGLFLIYLILGAQFKSYSQPFLIILSIPFSFAGVLLYLFFSGTPFSTTVLYAGVALAGIAVNDAIVLIDFINERRQAGADVGAAVREAARTRVRPILVTSITTIAGLLPTALGLGGTSVVWGPMAATISLGLVFSTASALIFLPALYGLLYDRKGRRPKQAGAPATSDPAAAPTPAAP